MRPLACFTYLSNNQSNVLTDDAGALRLLKLLQLADSALPIGSAAHSFGIETLVAEELLTVEHLAQFLEDYLHETGALESVFCRRAYVLASSSTLAEFESRWL